MYAPGAVGGGVGECTLHTRLLIYRQISVYISVCLLLSAAVWKSAHLNTRLLIQYIGIYRCMYRCLLPSAADLGVHTALRLYSDAIQAI